jgi:hypothetical protein
VNLGSVGALAQDATPASPGGRVPDLAAMALSAEDVPAGFFDEYSETSYTAAAFSALNLGGAQTPPGLERIYQSFYFNDAEGRAIHSFLFAFTSPETATTGGGIVDLALRPPLPDGTATEPIRSPEPALGDAGTITSVTYDTRAADGPLVDVIAAWFGHDRLLAGVAVERHHDAPEVIDPAVATPVTAASPAAQNIDRDLAVELAETVQGRIATVEGGQSPPGADRSLRALVLPVEQLVDADTPVLGGYKAGIDLLRCGICGEENTLLPFAGDALGGYNATVFAGPLVDGEPTPPFVSVVVSAFASPEAALGVLEATRQAPNDRPTAGPTPRGRRTLAEDPVVPGADAALAFSGALDEEDPAAPDDSAGVDLVVGELLVTVDVQGGLAADEAMAAAVDLATQQAACIEARGSCETVSRPEALP